MPRIYAIDFGTSNSLISAANENKVFEPVPIDPTALDPSVMRTLFFFPSASKVFYGNEALREFQEEGQGRLIRSIKKHLPQRSFIGTYIDNRPINLEDLIGLFLETMRKRANEHFQKDIDSVVLGRPARFHEDDATDRFAQSRLEIAAKKAGFKHIEFFQEPTAAACEFKSTLKEKKNVLVADFGGGTSDFTILKMDSGPFKPEDVLAIGGVSLAGDVLDGAVMRKRISKHFGADAKFQLPFSSNILTMPKHLIEKICSPADLSLLLKREVRDYLSRVEQFALKKEDKESVERLFTLIENQLGFPIFESIELAKRDLSEKPATKVLFDYPGIKIAEDISKPQFETYIQPDVTKIIGCLDETLKNSGLKASEIDVICCTGGTARVPLIQQELIQRFGKEKVTEYNRFHSIVKGLAERAKELVSK